jgi:hypothetical protein
MKCNFCNGKEERGFGYAPVVKIINQNNKFYLIAMGESDTKIEINYCPKCGVELTQ